MSAAGSSPPSSPVGKYSFKGFNAYYKAVAGGLWQLGRDTLLLYSVLLSNE